MTPTSRRSRATAFAIGLASVLLSSCGIVGDSSEAFSVDGNPYPRSGLNDLVRALSEANQLNIVKDQADGKDVRAVVNVMVQYRSGARVLEKLGRPVTKADRDAIASEVSSQMPPTMPRNVVDLLVDINATGLAIDKITALTEAQLKSTYESSPASTGALCIREITVPTRDQAVEVLDRLAGGARFADLAAKVSTSNGTKSKGGAVTGSSGEACMQVAAVAAEPSVGAAVVRAMLATPVDRTSGIVRDGAGWHVAVHRPFAEIKDSLGALVSGQPGRALVAGVLATADIRVNPVYGTWDPVTAKVE